MAQFTRFHTGPARRGLRAAAFAAGIACLAAPALAAEQAGRVISAGYPVHGSWVQLYAAGDGTDGPELLGHAKTDAAGEFAIHHAASDGALLYLVADGGATIFGLPGHPYSHIRFATVLGTSGAYGPVTVNERTTVATAYALNQFLAGKAISGPAPGPKNAAMMMMNLVDIHTGAIGDSLAGSPNGTETQTLPEFNSLANLLATCARPVGPDACDMLFEYATPPGMAAPTDTLQALQNIVDYPGNNFHHLFELSDTFDFYQPALDMAPPTWTLALRFVGNGHEIDGPGNTAFDADGNAWIVNNYVFRKSPYTTACGGKSILRMDPAGQHYPGSPYRGGGIYGVGYGVTMDPKGNVWASNFGFQGDGCEEKQRDKSLSKFSGTGKALSPDWIGYRQGDILRPQGMVSDTDGNIWTASCGNDALVVYRKGKPGRARHYTDFGVKKPFDVGVDADGNVWAAGNSNNRIARLDPKGKVLFRSERKAGGLKHPMGVAVDRWGNAWVANSGIIVAPCYKGESLNIPNPKDASISMFAPDGTAHGPLTGGGEFIPWGISLDGDNNVWVSNFGGFRLTHFCGAQPETCPPGVTTGMPISPATGYVFNGLTRNTSAQVDTAGNVWLTNNWLLDPIQTNPGGKEMVVFLGIATPVRTPVAGPPQHP